MKKFLSILTLMLFGAMPAFCETLTYFSVPIKDEKSECEMARVVVPENFEISSDVLWTRDFETPAKITITSKSLNDDVVFGYKSSKSYVDNLNTQELKNGELDYDFRTITKKKPLANDYFKEIIKEDYPQAKNITFVSEKKMPDGMDEYLIGLMYKKIDELNITAKADSRYAKISITNPEIVPAVSTFSYNLNGKEYYQTFLTVFSSVEYQFLGKNIKSTMKNKKFWKMKGLYSYRVEPKNYEKYFNDFVIYVANSMPNNKAVMAMGQVKQEMVIELNPYFVDANKQTSLKNKPSELFKRYFEQGLPDYSYTDTMVKPSLTQVRWLANIIDPQNEFSYRSLKQVWRQSFYVPKKYEFVYLNKKQNKWVVSTEAQRFGRGWTKLKQTKF